MRVLVAGDRGYIGAVLVPFLRAADLSKLDGTFPDLKLRRNVREGIGELVAAYTKYGLTHEDFASSRFVRLRRIRELLSAGIVDEMLCRRTEHPWTPDTESAPGAGRWL